MHDSAALPLSKAPGDPKVTAPQIDAQKSIGDADECKWLDDKERIVTTVSKTKTPRSPRQVGVERQSAVAVPAWPSPPNARGFCRSPDGTRESRSS
jgi:hypothetical protein